MGQRGSRIPDQLLKVYETLTVFSQYEIKNAWRKFESIHKEYTESNEDYTGKIVDENRRAIVNKSLPLEAFTTHFTEIKVNPFKVEICKYFSESQDGSLSFEDFLDMVSVLSHNARKDDKILCAFNIYDFDGDGFIGRNDLEMLLDRLCGFGTEQQQQEASDEAPAARTSEVLEPGHIELEESKRSIESPEKDQTRILNKLKESEKTIIIDKIFEESLMSNEDKLCLDDFAHIISKSPDFFKTFRVRI